MKTIRLVSKTTPLLLALLLQLSVYSQAPQGISYQAVIRNGSGVPIVDQFVGVEITLQNTLGTALYTETHLPKTNAQGVISITIGEGTLVGGKTFASIPWKAGDVLVKVRIDPAGGTAYAQIGEPTELKSVPYALFAENTKEVVSKPDAAADDPIFEVKNKLGQVVFGVYQGGVRVYVEDTQIKGAKGGFAVGGLSQTKAGNQPFYFKITPDTARININDSNTPKGAKGGFAVGGMSQTKAGGYSEYLRITPDSARIYIDDTPTKGAKGGFAVGGLSQTKGLNKNFFNIETGDKYIINPSQARILWYPLKNAFLTGEVLVKDSNDVGLNSFASGYQSKAKGQYSQALGYQAIALGDYSTAIGKNAIANNNNSFAFGDGSATSNENSYAFGKSSQAKGLSSYAFGEGVIAGSLSSGNCYAFGKMAQATGEGSYAFGKSAQATNSGSFAFGESAHASSPNSFAFGRGSVANGPNCYAFGESSQASNQNSFAFGAGSVASGSGSCAIGISCKALGLNSFAFGEHSQAKGSWTYAIGFHNKATWGPSYAFGDGTQCLNWGATSMGWLTKANANHSLVLGHHTITKTVASLVMGIANDTTALHTNSWDTWWGDDPVFVIGNGSVDWSGSDWVVTSRKNAFTILKSGATGINMNYPSYMLDVNGEITSRFGDAIRLRNDEYSTLMHCDLENYYLLVTNNKDPDGSWNSFRPLRVEYSTGNVFMGSNNNGANFSLVVQSDGKVGVGTLTPGYALDVKGRGRFIHNGAETAGFFLTKDDGTDRAFIGMASNDHVGLWGSGINWGLVMNANNGYVGIGTEDPLSNLEVKVTGGNGYAGIGINKVGGKNITLNQGTSGRLNFTVPGEVDLVTYDFISWRVGINNTSPSYPFQVGTGGGVNGNGAYLTAGGTWTAGSSRSFKDRFTALNATDVISKISGINVEGWFYKQTNEYHIGPVAEDFYNAFGTGDKNSQEVNKYLSSSDVAGVTMIAVKELIKQNTDQKQQIQRLEEKVKEIETLKSELEAIKVMLKK